MAQGTARKPAAPKRADGRDREATTARLLEAVATVMAREGFRGVGVNAVAREAGVDKVLIYRYFGGMPELIAAFARSGDFWPTLEELTEGDIEAFRTLPKEERAIRFFTNYVRAVRRRPLSVEIMAWTMVERNEITDELDRARREFSERAWAEFGDPPPKASYEQAIPAILVGAIYYLAARARHSEWWAGLNVGSDAGWARIEEAIEAILRGVVERGERLKLYE